MLVWYGCMCLSWQAGCLWEPQVMQNTLHSHKFHWNFLQQVSWYNYVIRATISSKKLYHELYDRIYKEFRAQFKPSFPYFKFSRIQWPVHLVAIYGRLCHITYRHVHWTASHHTVIVTHSFTNQTLLASNFIEFFLQCGAESVLGLFVIRLKSAEIIARNISGGYSQWPSVQ